MYRAFKHKSLGYFFSSHYYYNALCSANNMCISHYTLSRTKGNLGRYGGAQQSIKDVWMLTLQSVIKIRSNFKPQRCQHLHLAIRRFRTTVREVIRKVINIMMGQKVSRIREISKFVHHNMERLVYFQGTFCGISESWQLRNHCSGFSLAGVCYCLKAVDTIGSYSKKLLA